MLSRSVLGDLASHSFGFVPDDALANFQLPSPIFDGTSDFAAFSAMAIAVKVTPAPTLPKTALYLTEAGDTSAISVNDLHQGQIGDCFLISSIGELALTHSSAITNMIKQNANGTESVTLYTAPNGTSSYYGETTFKATTVTVNNNFLASGVNNGSNQDVVNGQKETWPQVLEEAVANLDGGYGAISNGGNPMIAMEQLTGHSASFMSPASLTLQGLQSDIAAGDLIAMDTPNNAGLPFNLVGNHAYMFEKLTITSGGAMVQLGNPWGVDQPALIPLAQLSKGFAEVDIGKFA